jgi:uncharacterized protein (TIGR03067 family)
MRRTAELLRLGLVVMLAAAAGCATQQRSDFAALQGKWKGHESGRNTENSVTVAFSGANLEYRASDPNVWYKATFCLREGANPKQLLAVITDCPFPQYAGKTAYAIYRLEDGVLRVTANQPGNPAVPADFDAPDARQFVLKAEKP